MLMSIPATCFLLSRVRGDAAKRLSLVIYGASLAFCLAASMCYHCARLGPAGTDLVERIDHVGVFVLIAGSYTPLAWNVLRGRWRSATLAAAWLLTAGIAIQIAMHGALAPAWSTGLCLAMGWGVVACFVELGRVLTRRQMAPLLLGGFAYTLGALLNVMRWPALVPGLFGPHDLFHVFVMVGSLAHFWFMLTVVAPYSPAGTPRPIRVKPIPINWRPEPPHRPPVGVRPWASWG